MPATSSATRQTTAVVHDAGPRPIMVKLDPSNGRLEIWPKGTRTCRHLVDLAKLYWHAVKYPDLQP